MSTAKDLRKTLYQSIQDLKEGTIDVAKAKQIASTAQTIINLGKVELEFLKLAGRKDSPFFPALGTGEEKEEPEPETIDQTLQEIEERNKEPYKTG